MFDVIDALDKGTFIRETTTKPIYLRSDPEYTKEMDPKWAQVVDLVEKLGCAPWGR